MANSWRKSYQGAAYALGMLAYLLLTVPEKGDGRRHAEQPIARLYGIPAARGDLDRRAAGEARPADRRGSSGIGAERPSALRA